MAKSLTVWPPPAYDGKVRFDVWETQLNMFMKASKITADDDKAMALLQHIGMEMLEKLIDWFAPDKPVDKTYAELIAKLKENFDVTPNLFALRTKFFCEKQSADQSVQQYISHMAQLLGQCALKDMTPEEYGIFAILRGLESDELRQYLMNPANSLKKIEDVRKLAVSYEQSKDAAMEIKGREDSARRFGMLKISRKCEYCGDAHQRGRDSCPAKDAICRNCNKKDHFAKVCKSEKHNFIEADSDEEHAMNGLYLRSVLTVSSKHEDYVKPYKVRAKLNGADVDFQHDTGAAVTVISKNVWKIIGKPKLFVSREKLQSYNKKIPVIGKSKIIVEVGKQIRHLWVMVVPQGASLFGRNWMEAFNMRLYGQYNQRKQQQSAAKYSQKLNTVTVARRRVQKEADLCSNWREWNTKADKVHAPMQGKVKEGALKQSINVRRLASNTFKNSGVTVSFSQFENSKCRESKDRVQSLSRSSWSAIERVSSEGKNRKLKSIEKIIDWCKSIKPSSKTYEELIDLINENCSKPPNLFASRVKFFNERQQDGQSLEEYFAHMTRLFGQCSLESMTAADFGVLAVLKGLANDDTRQHLMTSGTKMEDIAKVKELASLFEQGKAAARDIKGDGYNASSKPQGIYALGKDDKCKFCGEDHRQGKERCPAYGKRCSNCDKQNHFARVCKSSKKQNQVEEYSDDEPERDRERSTNGYLNGLYGVLSISSRHEEDHPPFEVKAKLNGTTVVFQHDSGAAVSVISQDVWNEIGEPRMHPTDIQLKSYTGRIPVIGQCKVFVQVGKLIKQQWIIIVPHGQSLFGRNFIQEFDVDSQRLCNQSKDKYRRDGATVCKQNTVMVQPIDRRCRKPKVCSLNTVNIVCSSDYRNAITEKKSCSWKKEAKLMHDPMQGKVKEGSGKDLNEWNGRALADKIRRKCPEGGVLKDCKSQSCKQSRSWIAKELKDAVNQENWRAVKDQDDHTSRSLKMKADEAVAEKNRESKGRRPKETELRGDTVAYTSRVEAYQSRGTVAEADRAKFNHRRDSLEAKIYKKAPYQSREGVRDKFK